MILFYRSIVKFYQGRNTCSSHGWLMIGLSYIDSFYYRLDVYTVISFIVMVGSINSGTVRHGHRSHRIIQIIELVYRCLCIEDRLYWPSPWTDLRSDHVLINVHTCSNNRWFQQSIRMESISIIKRLFEVEASKRIIDNFRWILRLMLNIDFFALFL